MVTLDVSSNGLESITGVEHLPRLKRLLANNNKVQNLAPLRGLKALVEIDIECNPVSSWAQVLLAVTDKKDILVLNLKLSPLLANLRSFEDCIN